MGFGGQDMCSQRHRLNSSSYLAAAQDYSPPIFPTPFPGQTHLEVLQAQLAAEELMLLPHVLLQVPEEAEGRQLGALWALMLQQLPGETLEPC